MWVSNAAASNAAQIKSISFLHDDIIIIASLFLVPFVRPFFLLSASECARVWPVVMSAFLFLGMLNLLFHLANIDVSDRISSVEYAGNFFESWTLSLNVEEVHEA